MWGACLDLLQNSGIKRCKTTVYIEYHNSKRLHIFPARWLLPAAQRGRQAVHESQSTYEPLDNTRALTLTWEPARFDSDQKTNKPEGGNK